MFYLNKLKNNGKNSTNKPKYSKQVDSQVRDLDAVIQKLNTTYQQELKDEVEAQKLLFKLMANSFKNKKVDLTTTDLTTLYTVPTATTTVVKSLLVSEDAGSGSTITITLSKF